MLSAIEGSAPVILSMPHAGIEIPAQYSRHLLSLWLARKDTDWWVDRLYDFAPALGVTLVRTAISRSIVDPNRDPSGASLYPGRPTTALCPTTTFDGEALYPGGGEPDAAEIEGRRARYFDPYHAAIAAQIARLRRTHPAVVLYDCHSIRSVVPRLFAGVLPDFNIGTYDGASCSAGVDGRRGGGLRLQWVFVGDQRPLQRRIYHPALWRPRWRGPRHPDGARLPGLHERAGRTLRAGELATGL